MRTFGSIKKMRYYSSISIVLGALLFGHVAPAQSVKLTEDPDIASYRTKFPASLQNTKQENVSSNSPKKCSKNRWEVTQRLHAGLDSVYENNKHIKYAQGYRILVYSGTDKLQMNQLKQKVYRLFPDGEVYTVFKQPEYRISFGDFIDKIQAYNYLVKIRTSIPDALIVQEQINIQGK